MLKFIKSWMIICCSMKTKVMGSSITSKTVSQDTISGENIVKEPIWNKMLEIAKKVLRVPSKDKEQIDNRGIRKPNYLPESNKEGETELEWRGKDLNHAREVYIDLIWTQEQTKKSIARTKHITKKRTGRDDYRWPRVRPSQLGKAPWKRFVTKPPVKDGAVPSGLKLTKTKKSHHSKPDTRVLMEFRCFQKSTELLIQKGPFYQLVREVFQAEKPVV